MAEVVQLYDIDLLRTWQDLQIESLEMELRRQAQDGAGQEVSQGRLETLESQEKLLKTKVRGQVKG